MNGLTALILGLCVAAIAFNKLFGTSYHEELEREVARHEKEQANG